MRRALSFLLILSLAAPAVVLGGACCPSDHVQTARASAEACCCQETRLCGSDAAAESLLEARLAAADSSHRTPTVFLTTDRRRVRSVTEFRPFRLASARAPLPTPLTITLPLRL